MCLFWRNQLFGEEHNYVSGSLRKMNVGMFQNICESNNHFCKIIKIRGVFSIRRMENCVFEMLVS